MKFLLSIGLFALVCYNLVSADQELANRLKPYEQYSPYQWTKWLELRPPAGGVAAAVAYTQPAAPAYKATNDEDEDELESDESVEDPSVGWFKRALSAESKEKDKEKKVKKTKSKITSESAVPKPTIVPMSFWGPPPTTTPNETVLLPPGYWAAKKSMFIAKLFEALAVSVLNSTGPPTAEVTTTTTMSPKDAILNELQTVLLGDIARSLPEASDESEESTEEPENQSEASEESEEEEPTTTKKAKLPKTVATTPVPTTTTTAPTTTTIDPILLGKLEFLSKLSEAIANQQAKLSTETLTTTTTAKPTGKAGKKGAKSKKKSSKKGKAEKGPTTPKWMKYVPTTTTTAPPPTINYDALARILLGDE